MEGVDWVLVHKGDDNLYLALTFNKVGTRKAGLGRPGWEFTEDFRNAHGFAGYKDLADKIKKHGIPIGTVKIRPYTNAHLTWMQRIPSPTNQ